MIQTLPQLNLISRIHFAGTTSLISEKWTFCGKHEIRAKNSVLIGDLQWGNGDPYTWSGKNENIGISCFDPTSYISTLK